MLTLIGVFYFLINTFANCNVNIGGSFKKNVFENDKVDNNINFFSVEMVH